MIPNDRGRLVRERLDRFLHALALEDLEERVAPVKCNKHPDSPECMDYYGVPAYGVPPEGAESGGEG